MSNGSDGFTNKTIDIHKMTNSTAKRETRIQSLINTTWTSSKCNLLMVEYNFLVSDRHSEELIARAFYTNVASRTHVCGKCIKVNISGSKIICKRLKEKQIYILMLINGDEEKKLWTTQRNDDILWHYY